MSLKSLEIIGFKSFAKKAEFEFNYPISSIVGPNGSGKSNIAEAFRFVLGEQSMKSLRGKKSEDMIFNGSSKVGRMNRASVALVFDNSRRLFDVDFDEVKVERTVHRDSTNEYSINGSRVRLKDVHEMLQAAHIGATGHHIISQGEADKILTASDRERKEIIEEALGLKLYEWKRAEAKKKLEKTEENVAHVESLKREVAPNLKFLKRQVEKIEKSREFRSTLSEIYREYFGAEERFVKSEQGRIRALREPLVSEEANIQKNINEQQQLIEKSNERNDENEDLLKAEESVRVCVSKKTSLQHELGRSEGEMNITVREMSRILNQDERSLTVSTVVVKEFLDSAEKTIKSAIESSDETHLRSAFTRLSEDVRVFRGHLENNKDIGRKGEFEKELKKLEVQVSDIKSRLRELEDEEVRFQAEYSEIKRQIDQKKSGSLEAEKMMVILMQSLGDVRRKIQDADYSMKENERLEIQYKSDIQDAVNICGPEAIRFKNDESTEANIGSDRGAQNKKRMEIERLKIRIEESGAGGGDDVVKEYEAAFQRYSFLEKEVADLNYSSASLKQIISDLENRLKSEFDDGLKKINEEFTKFFALMFGGGSASLQIVRKKTRRESVELDESDAGIVVESGVQEEGVEISVELKHKRVKGLVMLSGGERALTSIALIFAMSQVNPPPFIILDETDAALDEANSRKYGDMIERLSKHSQLILITHNRETMSRAGILYGITMGSDGVSKPLSIAFEEAVVVAK